MTAQTSQQGVSLKSEPASIEPAYSVPRLPQNCSLATWFCRRTSYHPRARARISRKPENITGDDGNEVFWVLDGAWQVRKLARLVKSTSGIGRWGTVVSLHCDLPRRPSYTSQHFLILTTPTGSHTGRWWIENKST